MNVKSSSLKKIENKLEKKNNKSNEKKKGLIRTVIRLKTKVARLKIKIGLMRKRWN